MMLGQFVYRLPEKEKKKKTRVRGKEREKIEHQKANVYEDELEASNRRAGRKGGRTSRGRAAHTDTHDGKTFMAGLGAEATVRGGSTAT